MKCTRYILRHFENQMNEVSAAFMMLGIAEVLLVAPGLFVGSCIHAG